MILLIFYNERIDGTRKENIKNKILHDGEDANCGKQFLRREGVP